MIRPVVEWALDNEVGLIPWTCPETMFAGLPRATRGIERYRRDGLGEVSAEIAGPFAEYLMRQVKGGVKILAIVGVSFSPACSAARQAFHRNETGLFLQALNLALPDSTIPFIDIHRTKPHATIRAVLDQLLDGR